MGQSECNVRGGVRERKKGRQIERYGLGGEREICEGSESEIEWRRREMSRDSDMWGRGERDREGE